MPEQPQWSERTLDMPPQDPWADPPTTPTAYPAGPSRPQSDHQPPSRHPQVQHTQVQHTQVQHPQAPHTQAPHTQVQHPQAQHTQVQRPAAAPQSGPPFQTGQPPAPAPAPSPFSRGRAQVTPRTEQFGHGPEPTSTGWTPEQSSEPVERKPLSWHIRRLRRGSEWSNAPLIFAFVSWGIWVLSSSGSIVTPVIVFITSLLVAAGVFAMARLAGRLVLERQLGRVRHTARGAHMATGLFLVGVGLAHLQQTEWVMDAVHWVTDLFGL